MKLSSPGEARAQPYNWLIHRIALKYLREAAPYAAGIALDIGCGWKPHLAIFERQVSTYVGLEHPRSPSGSTVVDVYGDGLRLPIRANAIDTVLSFQVLEHVPEPDDMMREFTRVLKPGGYLILTAPHIWGLHEEPHDYYRYTKYGLTYLCQKHGLDIEYVKAMSGYWVTTGQRFCYYLRGFYGFWLARWGIRLAWWLVQWASLALDRLHRVESDSWNYIVVANKRGNSI